MLRPHIVDALYEAAAWIFPPYVHRSLVSLGGTSV